MIYVCSDIHGMKDRYDQCISRITENDTLYILGDVIDRGEYGVEILKDIIKRPNVTLLIGNHEHMMLRALHKKDLYWDNIWTMAANGGAITKEKFLQEDSTVQQEILDYLNNCPLLLNIKVHGIPYVLLHSGAIEDEDQGDLFYKDADYGTQEYIVWNSPFRPDMYALLSNYKPGRFYLIGHVPVQRLGSDTIFQYNNIIDIDCGCAYGEKLSNGSLALLCLDNMIAEYIT